MNSAKVLASILLLLTFITAFPLEVVNENDSSTQRRSDLVIRQTTPPVSIAATGPGSWNSTSLVNTFEDLAADLEGVGGVLRNLTEALSTGLSQVSTTALHVVFGQLAVITHNLASVTDKIEDISGKLGSLLPNGPLKEIVDAVPESLKSLLGALEILENALSEVSVGDLNSFLSVFKALKGALNALIAVLKSTITFLAASKTLEAVSSGDSAKLKMLSNNLAIILINLTTLNGVQGVLGGLIGGTGTVTI